MAVADVVKCRQGFRIALIPAVVPAVVRGNPLIEDAGSSKGKPLDNFIGDFGSARTSHNTIYSCNALPKKSRPLGERFRKRRGRLALLTCKDKPQHQDDRFPDRP